MISFDALTSFKRHVLQEYPKEACGVLVSGVYLPCENTADDPRQTFRISAEELIRIELEHGRVEAILHSHPYSLVSPPRWPAEWPSTSDMTQWLKGSIPWGISATDGEVVGDPVWMNEGAPEPLEGRQFIHGINDCYSLIRDWFKEQGLTLPNYARGMEWWDRGQDLYSENFEAAGFHEIDPAEAKVGDCLLMSVRSPVVNHAAVIVGPNQILHHLFHRLSGVDRLDRWERFINKYVRYHIKDE